jgi:hypothetical protein
MYFNIGEQTPGQEDWIRLGRPKMYVKFYTDGTVVAWDEVAYGGIRLRVGDEEVEGKDMVQLHEYLALGYYYTSSDSAVYKRLK